MRTTGTFGAAARRARRVRLRSSGPGSPAFGVAVIAFTTRAHPGGHVHGHASLGSFIALVVVVGGYFAWRFFARRRRGGS